METSLNTNAELFKQLSYIATDELYMKKALKYVKKLAIQKEREEHNCAGIKKSMSEYSEKEFMNGLSCACEEVKSYKKGELQLKTWEELRHEL